MTNGIDDLKVDINVSIQPWLPGVTVMFHFYEILSEATLKVLRSTFSKSVCWFPMHDLTSLQNMSS